MGPQGTQIKGSPFLSPGDKYSFALWVKGHQPSSGEVSPKLSWVRGGLQGVSSCHPACKEVPARCNRGSPVWEMVWEKLVGPRSTARNLILPWSFSGCCAFSCHVWSSGCSVLQHVADAVLQAVPLPLASGARRFWEKHPESLFPPFNPALCSRNVILT